MRLKTTKIKELLGIFLFVILPLLAKSQCPTINSTVSIPNCGSSGCNLCTGDSVRINMTGYNFPSGTNLDWYISPNSGFDPYNNDGNYISSTPVNINNSACLICPKLLGILVNACNPPGNEQDNEFLLMSSGSGFNTNNLQIDYDANNNSGGGTNADVNINAAPCSIQYPSGSVQAMFSGCGNVTFAGPGVDVPAGALVVFFTSSNTTTNYDFSSLCNNGTAVYVLQSSCARLIGAFSDYASGSSIRTTKVSLANCMCTDALAYDRGNAGLNTGNGANVVKDPTSGVLSYSNNGCAPPSVTMPPINIPATSTFKFVADCSSPLINGTGTYYIKAIVNPLDPSCPEINTLEIKVNIACPDIFPAGPLEECVDPITGLATFHLTDLNSTITGGAPGATVIWKNLSGGIISPPEIVTSSTNTTVKATVSINGCKSAEILVDLHPLPLPVANPVNQSICKDPSTGLATINLTTLEASITGGSGNAVSWSTDQAGNMPIADPSNFSFSVVTIVYATVFDGKCKHTAKVTLTPLDAPNVNILPASPSFCEGSSVTLTATGSGGSGSNYNYNWTTPSGPVNGNSVTATVAGTYTVTITDGGGCTKSKSIDVLQNPKPIVIINPNPASFCIGSTLDLTALASSGTPPYVSYQWSTPTGPKTGMTININTTGTYNVTVTDNLGCKGVATIDVSNFTNPSVYIDPVNPLICNGGTIDLTAIGSGGSGSYVYNWTTPTGTNTGTTIVATEAGNYKVTVTDSNGCKSSSNITVNLNPDISIDINPNPAIYCPGSNVSITASVSGGTSPFNYNWTTPTGSQSGSSIIAGTPGLYTVTVTDKNLCTKTQNIQVNENPDIIVSINPNPASFCVGSSVTLTANANGGTGVLTYKWITPSGNFNTKSIQASIAGTYTVIVTDNNQCTKSLDITVTENTSLLISIDPNPAAICSGQSISLSAVAQGGDGNYSFNWATPVGTITSNPITVTKGGNYSVTVTDSKGCSGTASIIVKESGGFSSSIVSDSTAFCSGSGTNLNINVNGSGNPYTYAWVTPSGTANNQIIFAQTGGLYKVTITDKDGCTQKDSITINVLPKVNVNVNPTNVSFCNGASTVITVTGSGGTGNLQYLWTTPYGSDIGASLTVQAQGSYIVTVIDSKGCKNIDSTHVIVHPNPDIQVNPSNILLCTGSTNTIGAIVSSGTMPYSFQWNSLNGTFTPKNDSILIKSMGSYTVTVTDKNGCTDATSFTATEVSKLDVKIIPDPAVFCIGGNVEIEAKVNGGNGIYSYNWVTPIGNNINAKFITNTAGNYSVTVTDQSGCSGNANTNVAQTPNLIVNILPDVPSFCAGNSIDLSVEVIGGNNNYSYNWQTPVGNSAAAIITASTIGNYGITVTDSNGCNGSDLTDVKQSAGLGVTIQSPGTSLCPGAIFKLETVIAGGDGKYTYSWQTLTGIVHNPFINIQAGGTYSVTVTDGQGCTGTDNITIVELAKITVGVSFDTSNICNGYPLQITANVSNNPNNLVYSWTSPSGILTGNIINATSSGIYAVTVTDSNGCSGQNSIDMPILSPMVVTENITQPSCKVALGSYTIENIIGGKSPYDILWETGPSIQFNTTYQQTNLSPGQYSIIVKDGNDCQYTNDITIVNDVNALTINAGEDITVEKGDTAFINPGYTGNIIQYSWKPVNFLSCNNCPTAVVKPEVNVEYLIVVKDSLGCVASDKIKVSVIESDVAYIPNVFSPNADGINDLFTVYTTPRVKRIKEFQIYNRWGGHAFSLTNQDPSTIWGWNGKFNDQYVNPDVYVYYTVLELQNGQLKVFKGDITVFR